MGVSLDMGVARVLVVAHDRARGMILEVLLREVGVPKVMLSFSAEEALDCLRERPDVAFLFAALPEGVALRVIEHAVAACPIPSLVSVNDEVRSSSSPLARAGEHGELGWPADAEEIRACLEPADPSELLERSARYLVGRMGIRDAQEGLRRSMLSHALGASKGSRRAAARILGVTRPAVQRMLRDADAGSIPPPAPRRSDVVPSANASIRSRLSGRSR